jgi:hypothetical protein
LLVMTLFAMVTVAPLAKSAAGGTSIPPPSAITLSPANTAKKLE